MNVTGSNPSMTAYNGMQNGFERLNSNSTVIANPNSDSNETANALIDTKMTATDIEAMVKVLKTEDDLIGRLLDIKA